MSLIILIVTPIDVGGFIGSAFLLVLAKAWIAPVIEGLAVV